MKRFKHSLSHTVLSSFNMGQLVPVGNYEVLPGDSVKMSTSALIRCSPLVTPVMHPVRVRIHHWFVPYRIIWDDWEPFITGGEDGEGDGAVFPTVTGAPTVKGVWDYLGVPPSVTSSLSYLPVYAYNKIFNDFYRDQDLVAERLLTDDTTLARCAWEKDYFTTARPWTQKGPEVTLPLGTFAPVVSNVADGGDGRPLFDGVTSASVADSPISAQITTGNINTTDSPAAATQLRWADPKLVTDLAAATSATVNSLRLAMALQRYQEARAQYGSRYTEYLRYLGVRSSDGRLQRPEYLGGGRSTISFSEVLNTGGTDDAADVPQGAMTGHGISALRTRSFIRFFEEHGQVITLASVLPKTMYVDGLHKQWSRRTKEDYWQKELEQIGQQEVLNSEVRAAHASPNGTFGYQNRYDDYRRHPSYVTGEFRSTLNDWHFGRAFATDPALNSAFVTCTPTEVPFADNAEDVLWTMFAHSIKVRRMLGNKTIGRIF